MNKKLALIALIATSLASYSKLKSIGSMRPRPFFPNAYGTENFKLCSEALSSLRLPSLTCALPSKTTLTSAFYAALKADIPSLYSIGFNYVQRAASACIFGDAEGDLLQAALNGNSEKAQKALEILIQRAQEVAKAQNNHTTTTKQDTQSDADLNEIQKNQGIPAPNTTSTEVAHLDSPEISAPNITSPEITSLEAQTESTTAADATIPVTPQIDTAIVKALEAQNEKGETALHIAAAKGTVALITLLLEKGAPVDVRDKAGLTPLMAAAANGQCEAAQILVNHMADIDAKAMNNATALMFAAWAGHTPIIKLLLEKKCSIDLQKNDGFTALMLACRNGRIDVVKELLQAGAKVNIAKNDGWTALMLAAFNGRISIVTTLVDYGADVTLQNEDVLTAEQLARKEGHLAVVRIFEVKEKKDDLKRALDEITKHLDDEQKALYLSELINQAQKPPFGLYQRKCTNINVVENTLRADCIKRDGSYKKTSLPLPCEFMIDTDEGNLVCILGQLLPEGPYQSTCKDCTAKLNILRCTCKKWTYSEGDKQTSLKLPCKGTIENRQGDLVCE